METQTSRARQRPHSKLVTLQDVANVAGVTSMTVSKVIKGKGSISAATREKVMRVVEELNYTANPAARTLATGRTGIVAVICGELDKIYYANLVHLLQRHLTASGYEMRLLHTEREMKDLINATKTSVVDGVIVSGAHDLSEKPEFLRSQLAQRCVFIDTFEHPNTDYVRIDARGAIEEALEHMIAHGRQRIAYVGVSDSPTFDPSQAVEDRLCTYLAVMNKRGRTAEFINSRLDGGMNHAERIRAIKQHFESHGCPDGLLCLHGDIAMLTYRALSECGYRIPEDTLLVGGDDVPFLDCFGTTISAIAHPIEEVCALAWRFLERRINKSAHPLQQATHQARLVLRESMQPNC